MNRLAALLLPMLLPVVLHAQQPQGGQPKPLAFTHVTVIDVTGGPSKSDMTVTVAGNRIMAIGKTGKVRVPPEAQVIDASGRFLIPGLWDMHAHALLDSTYVWVFPLLVANGVTGIRDMGNNLPLGQINQIRADILQGRILGPRLVTTGKILDGIKAGQSAVGGASLTANSTAITTPEEARELVREYKRQGMDFIKVYNHLSRQEYLAIVDEAKRQTIPFEGHVPNALTAAEVSDLGQRSIEHNWDIFVSCSRDEAMLRQELEKIPYNQPINPARSDINDRAAATYDQAKAAKLFARFVRNGTWMCPTLVYFAQVALKEEELKDDLRLRYIPAYLKVIWSNQFRQRAGLKASAIKQLNDQRRLEIVGQMNRTGVGLLAGTDFNNAYVFPGFSLHEELEEFVKAGLSPLEALQTATINPAKFLGKEKELGTVEKGKLADLVLLDADPLQNIGNTQKISAVVANERLLDRKALDGLLAKAEAAANKEVGSGPETLALGSCEDTNLNFFLAATEARALVPSAVGTPVVTPLFGGDTTPLNVAHFHCGRASIGGRPVGPINFALVRFGLNPGGHYVMWVLTDSDPLSGALRSHGIDSHLVADGSLDIAGATWTTKWGGEFSPYSVVAHQVNRIQAPSGRIDWVFSGSQGIVHVTGSSALSEEFGDRNPVVRVPESSALRPFFERSRGNTALTHRMSLDLTMGPPH